MSATRKDRELFVANLCRIIPSAPDGPPAVYIAERASRLMRLGATLCRIEIDRCNGPDYSHCRWEEERQRMSRTWIEYQDKLPAKRDRIRSAIRKIVEELHNDLRAGFQDDPRGHTAVIIHRPSDRQFPIPTS